mmetsp:Transcript_90951/g.253091  ORF Transcript_90951/g.253091 Transcript_90951/m.253091 type:complete len:204 (+) Transcript_90951:361-972(+)
MLPEGQPNGTLHKPCGTASASDRPTSETASETASEAALLGAGPLGAGHSSLGCSPGSLTGPLRPRGTATSPGAATWQPRSSRTRTPVSRTGSLALPGPRVCCTRRSPGGATCCWMSSSVERPDSLSMSFAAPTPLARRGSQPLALPPGGRMAWARSSSIRRPASHKGSFALPHRRKGRPSMGKSLGGANWQAMSSSTLCPPWR